MRLEVKFVGTRVVDLPQDHCSCTPWLGEVRTLQNVVWGSLWKSSYFNKNKLWHIVEFFSVLGFVVIFVDSYFLCCCITSLEPTPPISHNIPQWWMMMMDDSLNSSPNIYRFRFNLCALFDDVHSKNYVLCSSSRAEAQHRGPSSWGDHVVTVMC